MDARAGGVPRCQRKTTVAIVEGRPLSLLPEEDHRRRCWRERIFARGGVPLAGRRWTAVEGNRSRASLVSPEIVSADSASPPPVVRASRGLEGFVPHLSSRGLLSLGRTRKEHGNGTSWATKWPDGLNRGDWARGMVGRGKRGEPLGKACIQTSPKCFSNVLLWSYSLKLIISWVVINFDQDRCIMPGHHLVQRTDMTRHDQDQHVVLSLDGERGLKGPQMLHS
jgi:hypothetical protein